MTFIRDCAIIFLLVMAVATAINGNRILKRLNDIEYRIGITGVTP
jgi:hypothetical protein